MRCSLCSDFRGLALVWVTGLYYLADIAHGVASGCPTRPVYKPVYKAIITNTTKPLILLAIKAI